MYQQERWAKWSKMKSGSAAAPCKRVILQDLAGKLFQTAATDRMLILSPALSHPLTFSKWHFLVLAQAWSKPSPLPWCCLLLFSRLLPIHANVGQDLSCLPEV